MKKAESFGIFVDFWDDDDVTGTVAWGLCGRRPRKPEGSKKKAFARLTTR